MDFEPLQTEAQIQTGWKAVKAFLASTLLPLRVKWARKSPFPETVSFIDFETPLFTYWVMTQV